MSKSTVLYALSISYSVASPLSKASLMSASRSPDVLQTTGTPQPMSCKAMAAARCVLPVP